MGEKDEVALAVAGVEEKDEDRVRAEDLVAEALPAIVFALPAVKKYRTKEVFRALM